MRRAVFVAALLLAVACIREKPDVSQDSPRRATESTTANPQAGTSQDTALNPTVPINTDSPTSRVPAAASAPSEVQLLEYEIRMPEALAAGNQTFRIVNAGTETHGFAIEGVDVKTPEITRGQSSPLTVNLPAGTFTVYCPVKGHREKGMQRTVTVR